MMLLAEIELAESLKKIILWFIKSVPILGSNSQSPESKVDGKEGDTRRLILHFIAMLSSCGLVVAWLRSF